MQGMDWLLLYLTLRLERMITMYSFIGDNNVDGAGVEETYKPGIPTTFNPQSMPHAIVSLPDADPDDPDMLTFLVTGFRWIPREVGDEMTNPRPSFAPKEGATFGRPINNMIFYRNRLCFMVDENIVMSKVRRTTLIFGLRLH